MTNDAEIPRLATTVVKMRTSLAERERGRATLLGMPSWAPTVALLFAGCLVLRWLFRSEYLINWDSVQFALGVETFDLAMHQPHPPGYIGYILLGRALASIVGDVPAALTLVSVVSGALAPVALFLLARRMLPGRVALATAALFGVSPLLWHYSDVALTYAPEVALSLFFALFVHRAREEGYLGDLIAAAITFAILGSVRQSAILLLAPLWVMALRRFPARTQLSATALFGVACLAWAVPLIWASGGPATYIRESVALADLAVGRTSFITAAFAGVFQNIGMLLLGVIIGMHTTLLVLWRARRRPGGSLGALRGRDRRFLLAWVIVPVAFFVLIHTGQPGYALLIIPVGYLWVGSAIAQLVADPKAAASVSGDSVDTGSVNTGSVDTGSMNAEPGNTGSVDTGSMSAESGNTGSPGAGSMSAGPGNTGSVGAGSMSAGPGNTGSVDTGSVSTASAPARRPRLATLSGLLFVSGVVVFFTLPALTYQAATSDLMAEVQEQVGFPSPAARNASYATETPTQSPLAQALRQYNIPRHDAYWSEIIAFIERYPTERFVVLTGIGGPIISGSFRQLGYYLPDYRVYAVGWDRGGEFGYLFRTHDRESTYTIAGLETASDLLTLPAGAQSLIIPDAEVAALLAPSILTSTHELESGTVVTIAHVGKQGVLEFHSRDDRATIGLR